MSRKKYYQTTDTAEVERLQKEGIKVIEISSTTPQVFTLDIVDKTNQEKDEEPVADESAAQEEPPKDEPKKEG